MNRRLGFRGRCQTDSGVIVRLRKNPRLRKRGTARVVTLLLNDNDLDLQGDIRSKLPSVRIRRYTASRSIKDRRIDLQRINEGRYVRPRPFWERYEDLKNRNRMSFRNVAKAVKVSTLERIEIQARKWHKWKMKFKDLRQSLTVFHGTLRGIEGRYGMAIMTYFRFVKWLMFLNFYIMLITFAILVIPFAALSPSKFDDILGNKSLPAAANVSSEVYNMTLQAVNCTQQYIRHTDQVHGSLHTGATLFVDLIQGTGYMERSMLFYGAYNNRTYEEDGHQTVYNIGVAYLISVFSSFLLSFILIIKNSAKNMKASHGVEKSVAQFTNKVFGGWDYCIKESRAANHKKKVIGGALAADLAEQERSKRLGLRTWVDWLEVWGMRIVINTLVFILLCGSLALIGLTTSKMIDESNGTKSSAGYTLFYQFVPHLTITLINLVVPRVFQKLVFFEEYKHETQIKITLFRSILLRLASPVALMVMLYHKLLLEDDEETKICGNLRWTADDDPSSVRCWETYVGQQVYKLLLIDIVVGILVVLLWHTPRRYINTKYRDRFKLVRLVGPQEFDLAKSVVDIIYAQNLCWFGLLFCPLIPAITLLHNIIVFFVKKVDLFKNCRPESRPYKTSKSTSLFMKVLLLSFMLAVVPAGYIVGKIQPSQSCGPFRMYSDHSYRMYHSLVNYVYSWNKAPQAVFFFIGTGIFVVPLLILLLLLMYYYWVIGRGYATKEEFALEDLKMEKMDTKFLLKQINKEKEELLRKDSDC